MLYLKRYCTVKKSWATPHLFSFARKNILPLQREEPVLCVSVSSLMSRVFRISFLKFYVTVDANKSSSSFSFGENLVKVAPNANKLLKTSHYLHNSQIHKIDTDFQSSSCLLLDNNPSTETISDDTLDNLLRSLFFNARILHQSVLSGLTNIKMFLWNWSGKRTGVLALELLPPPKCNTQ